MPRDRAPRATLALLTSALAAAPCLADTWRRAAPDAVASGPRYGHAGAFDAARGRVVIAAGGSAQGDRRDAWELGPAGWRLAPASPMAARARMAMAYDSVRNRIVLFGGYQGANGLLDDTWEYDGTTWREVPGSGPEARGHHAMAFDAARGVTVLYGGTSIYELRKDVWELDGNGWTPRGLGPPSMRPRLEHGMAYDPLRARSVVFGGLVPVGYLLEPTDEVWEWDGTDWSEGPRPPAALGRRNAHALAYDEARSRIVTFGGENLGRQFADTWLYDGNAWAPGPSSSAIPVRSLHVLVHDAVRGTTVMHGGVQWGGILLGDTWELGPAGWSQVATAPELTPRKRHAMTYDARREVVVLVGGDDGNMTADTWELGSSGWQAGAPAPAAMVPREGHGLVFDDARDVAVLFGGWQHAAGSYLDDTWEYDGAAWAPGPAAPAALDGRYGHGMAFDQRRNVSVLLGGSNGMTVHRDVWEYDGAAWRAGVAPPAAMSNRMLFGMAYDSRRSRTVCFGGWTSSQQLDDTWEYDGATWTAGPAAPQELIPREAPSMAYDDAAGRMVLFGGYTDGGFTVRNDTWEYDGIAWSAGPVAPPALDGRMDSALAFDGARNRTVLFGGEISYEAPGFGGWASAGDTWELRRDVGIADVLAGRGASPSNPAEVRVFTAAGAATPVTFYPYAANGWGANLASGLIGSGSAIVTGPGPGDVQAPHLRLFDRAGTALPASAFAYGTLRYGLEVSTGAVDADAHDEILTAPGPGAVFGPNVRAWDHDGSGLQPVPGLSFFAYGSLRYGAEVGSGDVDGDGAAEILTGPGPSPTFGPHVRGWDVDGVRLRPSPVSFFAFPASSFGARVAGGDVDGDGADEVLATQGAGLPMAARVRGFDVDGGPTLGIPGFDVVPFPSGYGGRIASGDLDADGRAELLAAPGPDPAAPSSIRAFGYAAGAVNARPPSFDAFPGASHGANVAMGGLGY